MMKNKYLKILIPVLAAIVLLAGGYLAGKNTAPDPYYETAYPSRSSYNIPIYTEQGGEKMVIASGGELQIESGATLDIQSGVTTDFSGGIDLDGALLDIDADGDTSIQADTDDQIDIEISAADDFKFTANTFTALSGSTIAANTIAETTATSGVTIDSLTVKDGGVSGDLPITGSADAIQLVVTGHTTQTSNLVTLEQQDGTDVVTVSDAGAVDIASTLNYGANDLYPVGFASSGQQLVYGTASITGTATAPHGLTTVTFCTATLGEDPTNGAGDAAHVTVAVSSNVCTLKAWQDDFVTAATEADVAVQWLVIGAP